jgi:tRNA pseudouridine32 synthase/23S rRNA pseudouridine746 synthase
LPAPPAILFADQRFVVINKPAGLPVHPGPRNSRSVEDYFPALSRRRNGPWLAHRLDADTSGCLVIALRHAALIAAQAEFAAGRARKTYWAIVDGRPAGDHGTIDAPLSKQTGRLGWRMDVRTGGQPAITDWRLLGHVAGMSWLELHPRTGRTHQVRVHCAHIGCPLIGDAIYGSGQGALQLLARSIELEVVPPLKACAEPSARMRDMLLAFEAAQAVSPT